MSRLFIGRINSGSRTTLFFDGAITSKTVSHAIKLLTENEEVKRINLTTHGGDVDAGLRLVSFLKENIPNLHVHVDGYAMSMGTAILGAAKKRTMGRDSMLMYHGIWKSVSGDYKTSDFDDLIKEHNFRISLISQIINPDRDPNIANFLSKAFKSRRDVYIGSTEALRLGLIDEIV